MNPSKNQIYEIDIQKEEWLQKENPAEVKKMENPNPDKTTEKANETTQHH